MLEFKYINHKNMTKFIIKEEDFLESKLRLDKFLTQHLDSSRSQIKKIIINGQVLVNKEKPTVHQFLKIADKIEILDKAPENQNNNKKEKTKIISLKKVLKSSNKFSLLHKSKNYLIIHKPSGLLVHPTETSTEKTLVDQLLEKFPTLKNVGESPERPALIHRLDKDVSGIMVIPRNQDMFDHLKKQFKTRKIKKEYFALVYGTFEKPTGKIDFKIIRSKKSGLMTGLPANDPRGKTATTLFEVITPFTNFTFLKLILKTGRTHQLRVHLHSLDRSIVGDRLYLQKKVKQRLKTKRIFLHAHTLGFSDLENNWQEFECKLPEELNKTLETLK